MAGQPHKAYLIGDHQIDLETRILWHDSERIHLPRRPFDVLIYLIENRERLISRAELLEKFWESADVYEDALSKAVGSIRKALGDQTGSPRFIETRWAGGYRYIGPFEELSEPTVVEVERLREVKVIVEEEEIHDAGPGINTRTARPRPHHRRFARTTAIVVGLLMLIISGLLVFHHERGQASIPNTNKINSIAVLPLKNLSGNAGDDYFTDGLTENLINELSKVRGLKVIARGSSFAFSGKEVDPREAGVKLGVATLLEGSVQRDEDRIRVYIRLVSTSDGQVLWSSTSYDRLQRDIFALQDEMACNVAEQLQMQLCGVIEPLRRTRNLEAYQAYLKGRFFISQQTSALGMEGALRRAIDYFQQAIAIDPSYAPAYAGLSDSYTQLNWCVAEDPRQVIAKAKEAALKAVQIDDSLAEAHTALGTAYLHDWNFSAAGREHQRALEINPGSGWAYHEYSTYLLAVGQSAEALAAIKRAQQLDPLNPTIMADEANTLYVAHLYNEAIARFHEVCKIDPACKSGADVANTQIGMCYLAMGRPEEAIRNCEADINANGRDPATLAVLAVAYAAAGRRSEVEQILAELSRLSQKEYVPKTFLADIYTALGEREGAFRMLNQAYFEHDINLMMIRTNQLLTPLQADGRFQKILDHLASVNQSVRNAAPGMVHPAIKTPESLRNAAIN